MPPSSYTTYAQPFVHPAIKNTTGMRVGDVEFKYGDVVSYEFISTIERDWEGQLLCTAIYAFLSSMFLIGILIGSLDWKFMIAVVFLGMIAYMSLCDAFGTRSVTLYILDITLYDGRQVRFADADAEVAETLAGRIERAWRR